MSINRLGEMGSPAWCGARKAERNAMSENTGFQEAVAEKMAQDKNASDEKAFASVGVNAPEEVKKAWMDAAKEVNANGMGIQSNGMISHISQMMEQQVIKMFKGETKNFDILGSTVESAIQATKQALYNLEQSIGYASRGKEAYEAREREFYKAFLEKLEQL